MNELTIGFVTGAVWVLLGFFVCVTAVDRCAFLKKWLDFSITISLTAVMLWPVALLMCSGSRLVTKRSRARESL